MTPEEEYEADMAAAAQQAPMFTPEQRQQRQQQNDQMMMLGLLGQLSGQQQISPVGAAIFKKALGDREERVSAQGIMDPLTGETFDSPQYRRDRAEAVAGRKLEKALAARAAQELAAQRAADRAAENHQRYLDRVALRGMGGGDGGKSVAQQRLDWQKEQAEAKQAEADAKKAAQAAETAAKDAAIMSAEEAMAMRQLNAIKEARKHIGLTSTGLAAATKNVPGTPAFKLNRILEGIGSQGALDAISAMRANSKTSSTGLGQITEKEWDRIVSAAGSLDPGIGTDNLLLNLATREKDLKEILNKIKVRRGATSAAPASSADWSITEVK
jgi:hypothetical protein